MYYELDCMLCLSDTIIVHSMAAELYVAYQCTTLIGWLCALRMSRFRHMASGWEKEESQPYVDDTLRDLTKVFKGISSRDGAAISRYLKYVRRWLVELGQKLTPAPGSLPRGVKKSLASLIYVPDPKTKTVNLLQLLAVASRSAAEMAPVVLEAGLCLCRLWECPLEERERQTFYDQAADVALLSIIWAMGYLRDNGTAALPSAAAMDASVAFLHAVVRYDGPSSLKSGLLGERIHGLRAPLWKVILNPALIKGE